MKGKKGVTSKEVVEKVVKEVGPTLGVRVHEVRPTRDTGAAIRTPSVAERAKVAANAKFGRAGGVRKGQALSEGNHLAGAPGDHLGRLYGGAICLELQA